MFNLIFVILILQTLQYFDVTRVKMAIDTGSQIYYKDKSNILFRPDQFFTGGKHNKILFEKDQQLKQEDHLIPLKNLDTHIFMTHRSLGAGEYFFKYEVPVLLPGTYNLIFCFIELQTEFHSENQRRFDILIDNYQYKQRYDIFKEAGGFMIPLYEYVEFHYRNDLIYMSDHTTIDLKDNKQILTIYFRGKNAKLDGLILYHGNTTSNQQSNQINQDILYDLNVFLNSNKQVDQVYPQPSIFIQAVLLKSENYANRQNNDKLSHLQLMNKYLSPFQQIIMNHIEKNSESQQSKNTNENANQGSIINYQHYFTLCSQLFIQLFNYLIEGFLNNKFVITALVLNFTLLWHCIVSKPKPQTFSEKKIKKNHINQKSRNK